MHPSLFLRTAFTDPESTLVGRILRESNPHTTIASMTEASFASRSRLLDTYSVVGLWSETHLNPSSPPVRSLVRDENYCRLYKARDRLPQANEISKMNSTNDTTTAKTARAPMYHSEGRKFPLTNANIRYAKMKIGMKNNPILLI